MVNNKYFVEKQKTCMVFIINILLIATIVSINFDFIKEFSKYNKISQTLLVPFVIYFDLSVASLGIVSSSVIHFKYFFSKK